MNFRFYYISFNIKKLGIKGEKFVEEKFYSGSCILINTCKVREWEIVIIIINILLGKPETFIYETSPDTCDFISNL